MLNLPISPLILASQSPRRQQLLKEAGFEFEVISPDIDETYPEDLPHKEVPVFLALKKAGAVQEKIQNNKAIIIGADTIVLLSNKILSKPASENEAAGMLAALSGRAHLVITGVAIVSGNVKKTFAVATKVFFKNLTKKEINYYIKNYRPFDKAGGYAIQEWIGMTGIEKIEGDYFNVVGLPMQRLYEALKKLNI